MTKLVPQCFMLPIEHYYSGIFFIPVSSLKVLGHSIHSERSRIYIKGNQCKLYKMTPLSYHDYSVSGSSRQQCSGIPLKLLCLFLSILFHHKANFFVKYQISIDLLTFRNKIQAKTFTWLYLRFRIDLHADRRI